VRLEDGAALLTCVYRLLAREPAERSAFGLRWDF
jgi:hypothetical protein